MHFFSWLIDYRLTQAVKNVIMTLLVIQWDALYLDEVSTPVSRNTKLSSVSDGAAAGAACRASWQAKADRKSKQRDDGILLMWQ
jgi:hypothetical protein